MEDKKSQLGWFNKHHKLCDAICVASTIGYAGAVTAELVQEDKWAHRDEIAINAKAHRASQELVK